MAERTDLTNRPTGEQAADRSVDEIRRDIAARRESIGQTVDKLSDRVQRTFDWREYVSEYPLAALGITAGVGFLVAGIFKPRPSPGQRILHALSETTEDLTSRFRDQLGELPGRRRGIGTSIKAAATAMVTKAVADYVKGQLRNAYASEQHPEEYSDVPPYRSGMRTPGYE